MLEASSAALTNPDPEPISGLTPTRTARYVYVHTGIKFRVAATTAIYRKCLRLSVAALQRRNTGEVINLMSIDAQRLQDLV